MKLRILTASIGIPALFFLLLFFYQTPFLNFLAAIVTGIAIYEMTWCTGMVKNKVMVCAAIAAGAGAFILEAFLLTNRTFWLGLLLLTFLATEIGAFFVCHRSASFQELCVTIVSAFFLVCAFGSLILLRNWAGNLGFYYILFAFACAWICDGGAYFVGRAFGRHKMAPRISPHKTWEGLAGGLLAGMAGVCLVSFLYSLFVPMRISYPLVLLVSLLGGLLSVFGDLSASVIKRQTGIKDFGNLIPGHGGILDRCDSLLFLTPFLCLVVSWGGVASPL